MVPSVDSTDGIYAEIDREAAMNGSFAEQATYLQTAVGGPFMSRAEARGRVNLPHVDGTDELIVPLNVTEGGQASPTDSGSQNRKDTWIRFMWYRGRRVRGNRRISKNMHEMAISKLILTR